MNIKLVVFDIAGTTVRDNNEVAKAFQHALKTYGHLLTFKEINPYMGYEKHYAISEILKATGNDVKTDQQLIHDIHKEFVKEMKAFYTGSENIIPLPDVESTMETLHGMGVKIAINTGFSREIADIIVQKLAWFEKGLIDFMIASDEVERGRPFPDMIFSLMKQAGIEDPQMVAKVGDTEVDINEGKNAGCKYVIGISTGSFSKAELKTYRPTHIIANLGEVLSILKA